MALNGPCLLVFTPRCVVLLTLCMGACVTNRLQYKGRSDSRSLLTLAYKALQLLSWVLSLGSLAPGEWASCYVVRVLGLRRRPCGEEVYGQKSVRNGGLPTTMWASLEADPPAAVRPWEDSGSSRQSDCHLMSNPEPEPWTKRSWIPNPQKLCETVSACVLSLNFGVFVMEH